MLQRLACGLALGLFASVPAAAEGPVIDHQPVACAVAERFPQLEARFAPAESVARARVLFQPDGGRHWYGVAMKPAGPAFAAVLPRPKKSLKSYRYYVEVTDTALGTGRTPEYTTQVAANAAACAQAKMAGGLASAAVTLEIPAGAPAVPVGFSANGVIAVAAAGAAGAGATAAGATAAAGGGGIPAAVLIGGGVAAAGAGAALAVSAAGGGGSTRYEGPFNGQFAIALFEAVPDRSGNRLTCTGTSSFAGTATVMLDQTSGAVSGTIQTDGSHTQISGTCLANTVLSWTVPLTGTAGSLGARGQYGPTTSPGVAVVTQTHLFEFSGALSGGVITGELTFTQSQQGVRDDGSRFSGDGSVTIPVTLR